jgi:hypothetical protein
VLLERMKPALIEELLLSSNENERSRRRSYNGSPVNAAHIFVNKTRFRTRNKKERKTRKEHRSSLRLLLEQPVVQARLTIMRKFGAARGLIFRNESHGMFQYLLCRSNVAHWHHQPGLDFRAESGPLHPSYPIKSFAGFHFPHESERERLKCFEGVLLLKIIGCGDRRQPVPCTAQASQSSKSPRYLSAHTYFPLRSVRRAPRLDHH